MIGASQVKSCDKRVQTPGMSPPRALAWTYCLFTMIGAQPMLIHIYSTLHLSHMCNVTLFIKGLCGLVVRMLDCRFCSTGFESPQVKKYFCFSYVN